MQNAKNKILVWLPSPLGDAVLCTPALRAIRQKFQSSQISFLAAPAIREILSPNGFNDKWLQQENATIFTTVKMLKAENFTKAVLFKNSFASALTVFMAKIPSRIGYTREARGFLLTEKLYPPKSSNTKFKPISMLDYYLAIASWLGADVIDRKLEIPIDPQATKSMHTKLPEIETSKAPTVIIVPGGAFGPSKCWPAERFAEIANRLVENYKANVIISVAPQEKQIAEKIADLSKYKLINSAERNLTIGELKSLFAIAELVITNDTGPRHMAIALERKIVSLFGPNSPQWTQTGYENEIQIIGKADCAPCAKPVCKRKEHLCMQSITVDMVCSATKESLRNELISSAL